MTWRNLVKGESSGVTAEFTIMVTAILFVLGVTGWLYYAAFQIK